MAKNSIPLADLTAISEHLKYEWDMLNKTAMLLRDLEQKHSSGHLPEGLWYALVESFAIHVRNLTEFLLYGCTEKYVRAVDFFDNPEDWTQNRDWPPVLKRAQQMANEQIAHLTYERTRVTQREMEWHVGPIVTAIRDVFVKLRRTAVDKNRHVLLQVLTDCGIAAPGPARQFTRTGELYTECSQQGRPHIAAATTAASTPTPRHFGLHGKTGD